MRQGSFLRGEKRMEDLNELALFSGAGGGILGGHLLGWRTVCAVEIEPYAAGVLVARQNDGLLPPFPVWDDICTFDGRPWRGIVDIVSGGFPCQDISAAGKGGGITGARSGLWKEMARVIGEVRPRFAWMENSPLLVGRGLAVVLADLAEMGYDARWGIVGADDAGAPHIRKRIWVYAANTDIEHDDGTGCGTGKISQFKTSTIPGVLLDPHRQRFQEQLPPTLADRPGQPDRRPVEDRDHPRWPVEPDVGRAFDGMASGMDFS